MATIKSFSDLQQSKKLAEILPLESADMLWEQHGTEHYVTIKPWTTIGKSIGCHCFSCWSLVALLGVLPILDNRSPVLSKTFDGKYRVIYHSTAYEKAIYTEDFDNPVDACVEMIELLHEQKLL